ncbi:hypothetical protein [Criblamydia sequanensis]|uniref:Uncharacterized protein n=1 Tax=Candidatus Criblamydia sequanensis CRIB-18 TaxID=1437425 RepID=A0A090CYG7_9BACT|nr:hypothetical protein [Criblamydia sequanensis]CDR33587.1 hypothetical protein CSEC_0756 [Criblamydia sequanensis CRIB-18]
MQPLVFPKYSPCDLESSPLGNYLVFSNLTNGEVYRVKIQGKELTGFKKDKLVTFFNELLDHKAIISETNLKKIRVSLDSHDNFKVILKETNRSIEIIKNIDKSSFSLQKPVECPRYKKFLKSLYRLARNFLRTLFGGKDPTFLKLNLELKKILDSLPLKEQRLIYKQMKNISAEEMQFFDYLSRCINFTLFDKSHFFLQIFRGAYVMIEDQGKSYDELKKIGSLKERTSSHVSDAKQFSLTGTCVKECLFSRKQIKKEDGSIQTFTWFQLERYPLKFGSRFLHLITYILYKLSGHNQGPYGSSPHREKSNPIIVQLKNPS